MGTHIIWRNPSPPRKREMQVSRITRNQFGAVYQAAAASGFRRLFEVRRGKWAVAAVAAATTTTATTTAMAAALPGAELVSARW